MFAINGDGLNIAIGKICQIAEKTYFAYKKHT